MIEPDQLLDVKREEGTFRVARRCYVDPDLYRAEEESIFSKCWLYLAHESELTKSNCFLTRKIAGRPLLLTRDASGNLRAFLNVCPHRGAQVCRHRSGSAKSFTCLYHGWTFSNDGRVLSITEPATYSRTFVDSDRNNLQQVPRLATYRGFIFVNYDHSACSLSDYLAGAREQIDLVVDQAELGMELVAGVQEYSVRANWKLLSENSVDILHGPILHATYVDLIARNSHRTMTLDHDRAGACRDLGNGHVVVEREAFQGRPIAKWIPIWGEQAKKEIADVYERLVKRHGAQRAHHMAHFSRNLLIFPNLAINDIMAITVRTWQPTAVDAMDVTAWSLAPLEERETPALTRRLSNFNEFFGPGGFASPDDAEALESCQRAFQAWREAPWNDLSKGFFNGDPHPNGELAQRAFWLKWHDSIARGFA